uniref:C2H2-type domain-containing protein n=1 Tax=viral metagenome TaxID=1070528 RepID=A0A6C0DIT1_9ZZZZ
MKFPCEDCGYAFTKNCDLIRHKPTCKKGVKKKETYTCKRCQKKYTMKSIFLKHIAACKVTEEKLNLETPCIKVNVKDSIVESKPEEQYTEQPENEEHIEYKTEEHIESKTGEHIETNPEEQKDREPLNSIEESLESQNKKIEKLALEIAELKKKPSIVVNKTVINNIIKNKYVQNNMLLYGLKPLDLSQERFNEIVDNKYSYKVYTNYGIVKDVFLNFFSNEEGEVCVMLSDRDRMKLKCIDKDKGIIYHDPKSMVGMCSSSEPLKEKTKEYEEQLTTNVYGEPNTVNIEDALKRREIIKDEKGIKRLMSQSSEKFLKKEISPELLKMVAE